MFSYPLISSPQFSSLLFSSLPLSYLTFFFFYGATARCRALASRYLTLPYLLFSSLLFSSLLFTVVTFKVLPLGSYAPMPAPSPPFKTILELVLWNVLQSYRRVTSDVIRVIKIPSFQYFLYLREQNNVLRGHSERDCHRSTTTQLWNANMPTSSNHNKVSVHCCHGKHAVASSRTLLSDHEWKTCIGLIFVSCL
jgi:hypothetical protein